MRLIDADALEPHEQLEPMGNGQYEYVEVVYKDDIDNVPTIDAVPVVRCRDCRYAKLFEERDGLCGHPSNNAWDIWDEFYCGRGVKHE